MAYNISGFDYEPIASAFANSATGAGITTIPNYSSATGTDREADTTTVTMEFGFAPRYARPVSDTTLPGKVMQRNELNGVLKKATAYQAFLMNGGNTTFDPNLVAITGGYPAGAILDYYDATNQILYKVRNMKSGLNADNFISDPTKIDGVSWKKLELGSYLPLTGGNLTGNTTVINKNIVRSVNGILADTDGNVAESRTTLFENSGGQGSGDITLISSWRDYRYLIVTGSDDEKVIVHSTFVDVDAMEFAVDNGRWFNIFTQVNDANDYDIAYGSLWTVAPTSKGTTDTLLKSVKPTDKKISSGEKSVLFKIVGVK